jgi:hypothetical protein
MTGPFDNRSDFKEVLAVNVLHFQPLFNALTQRSLFSVANWLPKQFRDKFQTISKLKMDFIGRFNRLKTFSKGSVN